MTETYETFVNENNITITNLNKIIDGYKEREKVMLAKIVSLEQSLRLKEEQLKNKK